MSFSLVRVCQGCPDLLLKLEEGEEDLCEGLNLDNAPLNFDVGDDIICCSPQEHIESDHTLPNGLFVYKNIISVTDSNFTTDNPLEVGHFCFFFVSFYANLNIITINSA